jgi:hypothetical protein
MEVASLIRPKSAFEYFICTCGRKVYLTDAGVARILNVTDSRVNKLIENQYMFDASGRYESVKLWVEMERDHSNDKLFCKLMITYHDGSVEYVAKQEVLV